MKTKSFKDIFNQGMALMRQNHGTPEKDERRHKIAQIMYRYFDNIEAAHRRPTTQCKRKLYAGY